MLPGTTDLMLGAYHTGARPNDQTLAYFVQGRCQFTVWSRDGDRPGKELDAASGPNSDFGQHAVFDKVVAAALFKSEGAYAFRCIFFCCKMSVSFRTLQVS